jgi:hypothetical protein
VAVCTRTASPDHGDALYGADVSEEFQFLVTRMSPCYDRLATRSLLP